MHYRPVMLREAKVLLQSILAKPDNFCRSSQEVSTIFGLNSILQLSRRGMAGATIMMVIWTPDSSGER